MTGGAAYILLQGVTDELSQRIDNLPKAFVPQGSITFANLPAQVTSDKLGYIWNITDSFTTDSRFIEGAGKKIDAGNNVAVIKHDNSYYYDVMSQIDLSSYYTKTEVDTKVTDEATARSTADTTLTNAITDEVNNRTTAINTVNESIDQEATTREQADSTLTTNLSNETANRTNADNVLQSHINAKQDKLTAGTNITIDDNNVISSINTTYTAGDGITISDNTIGVTYGKYVERESATTADRLVAYKDNTGLQKQIAVDWDSSLGRLSTSEFNATTVGGGEGKVTAAKLSDGTTTSNMSDVLSGAALGATALQEHQDISGKLDVLPTVEDPEDPGYGYPYWIPYSFATTPKTDGLDITLKTLTLDNTLRKMNFTNAFPVVTTSQAGIMTASDKIKLNSAITEHQDISGKQDKLTAGTGIDITDNIISLDDDASIAIYDNRIADANSWLTNGYTKTSATIPTANLPDVCTEDDRWGVLLYVAENNENKAGLQQYFPIDGTYKGRVFYRSVTGWGAGIDPEFGDWELVPWYSEKQNTLTAGTNITISSDNVISATGSGTSYTAETPIEIDSNTIKHKEYFSKDSYAFGIVYYDKYGHITQINGQEVTGGLLHQANKITVNAGKGLTVDSDSNELKAVGVEYKNNTTVQSNALKFVRLTQAQYDALTSTDADTLYIIIG